MTGTPSEPSKEELHDDLSDGGATSPPDDKVEAPSDEAQEKQETHKPTKKKKKDAASRPRPKPVARGIALFVLIGIPAALLLFSRQDRGKGGGLPASTRWAVGSEQEINITLVAQDKTNLACASPEELDGKHCEFEAKDKKWSKGGSAEDTALLKPYRLAGSNDPALIAGLWSDPALKGNLPPNRFSARCKFKVLGKLKKPAVRWFPKESWFDEPFDWPVGSVSGCSIVK
jgi:hypothetical protein